MSASGDSSKSKSGIGLVEALAERDAAAHQVATLQQQLRRQQADAHAAMQRELESMQKECHSSSITRVSIDSIHVG